MMRCMHSQMNGGMGAIDQVSSHVQDLDSLFDDLEAQVTMYGSQLKCFTITSEVHQEMLNKGQLQNIVLVASRILDKDFVQQLSMVVVEISSSQGHEDEAKDFHEIHNGLSAL